MVNEFLLGLGCTSPQNVTRISPSQATLANQSDLLFAGHLRGVPILLLTWRPPAAEPLIPYTPPTVHPNGPFRRKPHQIQLVSRGSGLGTALVFGQYLYRGSEYATRRAFRRYTAVDDLSVLGRERKAAKLKGTVVIAGGRSVAHSCAPFSSGHRDLTPSE